MWFPDDTVLQELVGAIPGKRLGLGFSYHDFWVLPIGV